MWRILHKLGLRVGYLWSTIKLSYLLDQCISHGQMIGAVCVRGCNNTRICTCNGNGLYPIFVYDPLVDWVSGGVASAVVATWQKRLTAVIINSKLLLRGEPDLSAFVWHELGHLIHGDLNNQQVKHQTPVGQVDTEILADNFTALHGYAPTMIGLLKEMRERVKVPWYVNGDQIYQEIDKRIANLEKFNQLHGYVMMKPIKILTKEEKDADI